MDHLAIPEHRPSRSRHDNTPQIDHRAFFARLQSPCALASTRCHTQSRDGSRPAFQLEQQLLNAQALASARAVDALPRARKAHVHRLLEAQRRAPQHRPDQPGRERVAGAVGIELAGEGQRRQQH
eukprot:5476997-Prymnesium_polylepis.1